MNISKLNQYKEDGWLMNQFHPTLPLIIWNYTPKTQYEQFWDEVTLICRGLVTDTDGNIISRGFPKFFNIEETKHTPTNDFDVFEKLDGQYIGVFWYEGEMVVNSRGSFTSPYAIEAKRILEEKHIDFISSAIKGLTYCFELLGFEQIVVSYPKIDLILTGIFNNFGTDWFCEVSDELYVPIVKKYSGLDYRNIKQLNWKNSEGFVVRFSNGQRCKIKFEDYVKLHRQMTNLSTTSIWEALMNGRPVSSILSDVPDEFYDKVHKYESELRLNYSIAESVSKDAFSKISIHGYNTRSEFATIAKIYQNTSILFAMLDGKDYSKMIWKKLKPKFEKI